MYNSQVVYDRIEQIMKQQNKTFGELNEKCGFNKNTVSQSAKSQDGMKARRLYAIAEFLECSVDYLLGRTDNPQAHISSSSVSVGSVQGNSGAIGVGNTVTNSAAPNDEQTTAMLEAYKKLSPLNKAKLLVYADELNK